MKKALILFYLSFLGLVAQGQTTFIPDSNFRKCLMAKPELFGFFNANGELIDTKAANYNGGLDCSYRKIRNLKGIEKFTLLTSLACQYNMISNLDSIANLTNLQNIYCFNNTLTSLPKLEKLTRLSYLSCGNNQLTLLPDLSKCPFIYYLDCSNNQITSLPGLDKLIGLKELYAFSNKLEALPDLSKFPWLVTLIVHNNQLANMNGLSKLTQLISLGIGNNPFTISRLPDLSALTKLFILECWNCNLTNAPEVTTMKTLYKLNLSGNSIRQMPSLASNTNLRILNLKSNLLDALPNELSKHAMDSVLVDENKLTFEDILLLTNGNIKHVSYSFQDSVTLSQANAAIENSSVSLVAGIDKSVTNNIYSWYKDGFFLKTTFTDTLTISSLQNKDSGVYTYSVRNTIAPMLTLYSKPLDIHVCFDIATLKYNTTDFDCNIGGTIRLHENTLNGAKPYAYSLVGPETGKVHYTNGAIFSNLFDSAYKLEVKDNAGCKSTLTIALKGKSPEDCKGLVILGDDYSQNNTLFLEEKGTAKVYDKTGQLVHTFSTPVTWDGKNKNGEFLPGYYVIDLNGKIFNVTLIK